MPDILIQFHALPEELLPLVQASVNDFRLHVVAIKHFPFRAEEVAPELLPEVMSGAEWEEIAFTIAKPVLPASRGGEFADKNPDKLRLQIGRKTAKGLEESCLSARTSDLKALSTWKKVAKRLKRITTAGAVAVNPDTGATAESRNHRFTQGAKNLELEGVPILPVGGSCLLRLRRAEKGGKRSALDI